MKKRLLLSSLIIILVSVNSCKKEPKASFSEVVIPSTVSAAEILAWFDQTPQVKPADILLNEAEQETVNGKQVVRIPVATNAALYFTKENDSLKVYAYKWVYNAPYTDKYTGKIDIYDFQEQDFKRYTYNNGMLNHITTLRKRPALSVSGSLQTFDIWTGLAEIWCYISGGTWYDGTGNSDGGGHGEVGKPACNYPDYTGAPSGDVPSLPDDIYADDSGDVYTSAGGGSGGGIGWGPPPCPPGSHPIENSIGKNHVNNMPLPPGGGGCPTAPDGSAWLPYSVFGSNSFAASLVQTLNITDSRKEMFLILNKDIAYELYIFLQQKGDSPATEDQLNWSINYLMANPSVSIDDFKNQFLGLHEGPDDSAYDSTYWDDPNLSFVSQNLPTWSAFYAAFPLESNPLYATPGLIYHSVGGALMQFYHGDDTNTCALRMSKALNYSGVTIPNLPGKTYKGDDNKYYFIRAIDINKWMRKTFGTSDDPSTPYNANHYHYTKAQAGVHGVNLPNLLKGKKGIYSLVSSDISWASGHADLLYATATCGSDCYFYDAPIAYIDVWVLN